MCGIEAFCLFLRTNCIKGYLIFRIHQDIPVFWSFRKNDRMSYHVTYWKAFMCTKFRFGSILFAKAILKKPFLFRKIRSKDKKANYNSIKTAQQKGLLTSRLSCQGIKGQSCIRLVSNFSRDSYILWYPQLCFFSKLTKPEVQNSCQQYYKGVVGQRRGNNRLQKQSVFLRIQVRASSQTKRTRYWFLNWFWEKNRLFCSLWQ